MYVIQETEPLTAAMKETYSIFMLQQAAKHIDPKELWKKDETQTNTRNIQLSDVAHRIANRELYETPKPKKHRTHKTDTQIPPLMTIGKQIQEKKPNPPLLARLASRELGDIIVLADSGANMNAIAEDMVGNLKRHKLSQSFFANTCNGPCKISEFVYLTLRRNGKTMREQFWIFPKLSNDFVFSCQVCRTLGLINSGFKPVHFQTTDDNLQLPNDVLRKHFLDYPVSNTPKTENVLCTIEHNGYASVELTDLDYIRNKQAQQHIYKLLKKYDDVNAKHESDVGRVPGVELRSRLKRCKKPISRTLLPNPGTTPPRSETSNARTRKSRSYFHE